jgi:hypothetical protein
MKMMVTTQSLLHGMPTPPLLLLLLLVPLALALPPARALTAVRALLLLLPLLRCRRPPQPLPLLVWRPALL